MSSTYKFLRVLFTLYQCPSKPRSARHTTSERSGTHASAGLCVGKRARRRDKSVSLRYGAVVVAVHPKSLF